MKERILRIIGAVGSVAVILAILFFSLQRGEQSTGSSNQVTYALYLAVHGKTDGLDPTRFDSLDALIRIGAHVSEYMALSFFVGIWMTGVGVRRKLRLFYMIAVCFAMSIVDEALQTFVPGRYGDLLDIFSDTLGASLVATVWYSLGRGRRLPEPLERRRDFLGIRLDDVYRNTALDRIMKMAEDTGGRHYITTANADHIVKLKKDEAFREVYAHADMVVADGMPLLWIAEAYDIPICERVTGADLFPLVCERAAAEGRSVYFLGGSPGTAEKAAERMCKDYPGLKVAGFSAPSFGFEKDEAETASVIRKIKKASPDILMVCFGAPRSEKFIYRYRRKMNFAVALPFGAAIDFAAENVKRAPLWMQKCGLEWFHRFLQDPGRLFKRYFIDDMQIFLLAMKYNRQFRAEAEAARGTLNK